MQRSTRILLILLSIFVIRLTFSCCRCTSELVFFEYNEISIANLDNSIWRSINHNGDKMLATAVAFEIVLQDSTIGEERIASHHRAPLGLPSAMAFQPCDCGFTFKPSQEIIKISIITLEDISDEIPADTDVTENFVCQSKSDYLYESVETFVEKLNATFISFQPFNPIRIFLKDKVENDQARFVVFVYLSDGRVISVVSDLIQIMEGKP